MPSNKKLGNDFEREMCDILSRRGYWVHFIAPDARGAQPFDIIAVKAGQAVAIDCKTCVANNFSLSRLEDNQIMAFEKWLACGNEMPRIAIRHKKMIYMIPYRFLKEMGSINLKSIDPWMEVDEP